MAVMKKTRIQMKFELRRVTKGLVDGQYVHIVMDVLCNDVCNVSFVCTSISGT